VKEILLHNHKLRIAIAYGVLNSLYEYLTYFLNLVCSFIAHVLTVLVGISEEKSHLEDLGVNGRIRLNIYFQEIG
jgi:hypothetical protein